MQIFIPEKYILVFTRICLAIAFFCAAACTEKDISAGTNPVDTADWSIKSCALQYKNDQLFIGTPVSDWEKVLGAHDRYVNGMYIFDRHGLKLYEREGVIVTMVLVYKNRPVYEIHSEENDSMQSFYQNANDARPGLEYQRSVNIDGGIVKPKMSMEEFNRQRRVENPEANLFTEAYLPTIYHLYRHCDSEKASLNYVGMRIEFQVGSTTDVQQFAFGGEVR